MMPSPFFLLSALALAPAAPLPAERSGTAYEISQEVETESRDDGVSTGSSHDRDAVRERVIAIRPDGLELEYDLPTTVPAEERARAWQFPVRILRAPAGPPRLLNGIELAARAEGWLRRAKLTRAACGRWLFTWTAQRIECDPRSALDIVAAFDLRQPDLRAGMPYREPGAAAPARLESGDTPDGPALSATMALDPERIRREAAESDVAVGEMTRKPVTLPAALGARAADRIEGRITVTFQIDAAGRPWRKASVAEIATTHADGRRETRRITTIVRRRIVAD